MTGELLGRLPIRSEACQPTVERDERCGEEISTLLRAKPSKDGGAEPRGYRVSSRNASRAASEFRQFVGVAAAFLIIAAAPTPLSNGSPQ